MEGREGAVERGGRVDGSVDRKEGGGCDGKRGREGERMGGREGGREGGSVRKRVDGRQQEKGGRYMFAGYS